MATYEIVRSTALNSPADVVKDLPPTGSGAVLFYQGNFWHVDAIEPAQTGKAEVRLIVSLTTEEPKPSAA
jgi:hypothetical protein